MLNYLPLYKFNMSKYNKKEKQTVFYCKFLKKVHITARKFINYKSRQAKSIDKELFFLSKKFAVFFKFGIYYIYEGGSHGGEY